MQTSLDPHAGEPVLRLGPSAQQARLAVILIHGRGASAEDILSVAHELRVPDVLYLAPQAAGNTWYPYSFLAPLEDNEPGLSSGLARIGSLLAELARDGVPASRVGLVGFSQGACLSLEYAARHPQRYAAVAGLSGGVIGPMGAPRTDQGSMAGTPVFLGCSDIDPHIPVARVHESAEVFRRLQAVVDERIYRNMGHLVNEDEIAAVRALLSPQRS